MNLFQFAVASIVDANTGQGLSHRGGQIDYAAAERNGRSIRAKSVIAVLQRIRQGVSSTFAGLGEYRARQQGIQQLARLDNHSLEDIGFTRGDIIALQTGQIDLQQLEARRTSNLDTNRVRSRTRYHAGRVTELRSASNEAVFASAKCA